MKRLRKKLGVVLLLIGLATLVVLYFLLGLPHLPIPNHRRFPLAMDSDGEKALDSENHADSDESFPKVNNLSRTKADWILATTDPNQDIYRNDLTFRNVQQHIGHRHDPSEIAFNRGGCKSMLTLRIVDQDGKPVAGVPVQVAPMLNWKHFPPSSACTDDDGCIILQHSCANSYTIFVSKDGFYDIYGTIHFFSHHYICVEDGRWIPWNPHVELILRQIGPMVKLEHFKSWEHPPEFPSDMDVPFDFLCCDFLPPYGNGRETNAVIRMSGSIDGDRSRHSVTSIAFPHGGGMRKEVVNGFSRFAFPREIADSDFCEAVTIQRDSSRDSREKITGGLIRGIEYFALKIPAKTDSGTNEFVYGVITEGPTADLIDEGSPNATLFMECYLNTEIGNRVIESKQLIGK